MLALRYALTEARRLISSTGQWSPGMDKPDNQFIAVMIAGADHDKELVNRMLAAVRAALPAPHESCIDYAKYPKRTQDQVVEVFDRAIRLVDIAIKREEPTDD